MQEKPRVTKTEVLRAFQIYPSHTYQLEARGILPHLPRGVVTGEYILALADYIRTRRGSLAPEGAALLDTVAGGADGQ